jgi:hypothetical protein
MCAVTNSRILRAPSVPHSSQTDSVREMLIVRCTTKQLKFPAEVPGFSE